MELFRRGLRRYHRATTITAAVTAVALVAVVPVSAQEVTRTPAARVIGELTTERLTIRLGDGTVARGDLLRFPESSPHLELRPRLAQGTITGLQNPASMARSEYQRGGVAGTNGGYWIDRPSANPNGLHVQGRRLAGSNASAQGGGWRSRSALGIGPQGGLVMDRVDVQMPLTIPGGPPLNISFTNRQVYLNSDVVLYERTYGRGILVPAGAALIVTDDLAVRSSGTRSGTVRSVEWPTRDVTRTLASGTNAIVVNVSAANNYGKTSSALTALRAGQQVSVSTSIVPQSTAANRWNNLSGALPAGGTLLRNGQVQPLTDWTAEAFSDSQFTARHPRTAIGRRANGEVLLLTVDGRQPGWSVGLTGRELAVVFQRLGAVEAVNLDGGGSTTMTIGGTVRNRPSQTNRAVASGLFVHAPLPPPARSASRACPPGRVPPSGFTDITGHLHAPEIECLRWWGMTTGMTPTTYAPTRTTNRQAMATMLARFIDHAAANGSGRPLPPPGRNRFTDVPDGTVHEYNISRLTAAGIIKGSSPTTYSPMNPVNRGQAAALIARSHAYVTGKPLAPFRDTFRDDNGNEHEDSIDRLAGAGVVAGIGGFDVAPKRSLPRSAMAPFLMRWADLLVEAGVVTPPR